MWRGSTESGCSYLGRAARALIAGRQQSAEAIVGEANLDSMKPILVVSESGEASSEGQNVKLLLSIIALGYHLWVTESLDKPADGSERQG